MVLLLVVVEVCVLDLFGCVFIVCGVEIVCVGCICVVDG